MNTGISATLSESVPTQAIFPARAASTVDVFAQNAVLPPAVTDYKMTRSLVCVTDAQREYKVGLGGNPSIENLDRFYRNAWRGTPAETKFYTCRLVLYNQIKYLAKELFVSETVAGQNLERQLTSSKPITGQLSEIIKVQTLKYYLLKQLSNYQLKYYEQYIVISFVYCVLVC